jgi:hypothetical protein
MLVPWRTNVRAVRALLALPRDERVQVLAYYGLLRSGLAAQVLA